VVVRRSIFAVGRVALSGDEHEPQIGLRREHGRTRADDDVEATREDLQPSPISDPAVTTQKHPDALPERLVDGRGRGRRRGCLGYDHYRPATTSETGRHSLDSDVHLVFRSRTDDERPGAPADRPDELRTVPIADQGSRRDDRSCYLPDRTE
jgi:hypothetical protein